MLTPQEIGRQARALFVAACPASWARREQEGKDDVGIDYEVEPLASDKGTGAIFKVQVKGQAGPLPPDGGGMVPFSGISVERLGYYLEAMAIPTFLVGVDVSASHVYWVALQGNREVEAAYRLARERKQAAITIRVPRSNELPSTAEEMVEGYAEVQDLLAVRAIESLSVGRVRAVAIQDESIDRLEAALTEKRDVLRIEQLDRLIVSGQAEEAKTRAGVLFRSPSERVEMRFEAADQLMRAMFATFPRDPVPGRREVATRGLLEVTQELLGLARTGTRNRALRRYARFLLRTTRLRGLVERDFGLFMNAIVNAEYGGPAERLIARVSRSRLRIDLVRELNRTRVTAGRLASKGSFVFTPRAYSRIVGDVSPLVQRLWHEGQRAASSAIVDWTDTVLDVAVQFSIHLKDWETVAGCATRIPLLIMPHDEASRVARFALARTVAGLIADVAVRQGAVRSLDGFESQLRAMAPGHASLVEEAEMYVDMAAGYGIRLDDETNPDSQMLQLGLRDLNPGRVLRECRHLHLNSGVQGRVAALLQMPSAGEKILGCMLFGYGVRGMHLDQVYDAFKVKHCAACKSCEPHSPDWAWSHEWHADQHAKYLASRPRKG